MKILIVEDDEILSQFLRDYLQRQKHEQIDVCDTAADALVLVQSEDYDCAFIDVMLPDMSGLQLIQQIRTQNLALPVIVMSGYATLDFAIEAMRTGASDFLTKPFGLNEMAIALERVTKERALLLENLSLRLTSEARQQLEVVNKQLEERIEDQSKLFNISRTIDETASSDILYERMVQLAAHVTAAKQTAFFLMPPDENKLVLISEHGSGDVALLQKVFETGNGTFSGRMCASNSPLIIRPDSLSDPQLKREFADQSMLSCWPLHIRGKLFGFLATVHNGVEKSLSERECSFLDFLIQKASLAIENMALYESMIGNFYGILKSLVNALEAKDPYTGKHSERVTHYALAIAREIGCSEDQLDSLKTVGYLHDIGKIGLADSILNKPASLSGEEWQLVKKHPVIGESIVADLGLSPDERAIIRHHHEHWDGSGYPDGLSQRDIPLLARIIMVADAFDAMTSKRAYRDALPIPDAVSELIKNRGRQFDGDIVDAFLESLKKSGML
ncbi:HD domain-containing phosphohydrolase [Desulfoferrobacter suflitae]|uniref:HD domain-containing phosphohydrolase n=1 Tax=Desulfoferrobacter suflitae TaxID=2865782 RepID=UPI002164353C|nr:HD domain-containing phosphohydrolase [Desulfoferrobacter suflitae]MCK8602391.1 response regulator [Desulfoferrobacter suflitae]